MRDRLPSEAGKRSYDVTTEIALMKTILRSPMLAQDDIDFRPHTQMP